MPTVTFILKSAIYFLECKIWSQSQKCRLEDRLFSVDSKLEIIGCITNPWPTHGFRPLSHWIDPKWLILYDYYFPTLCSIHRTRPTSWIAGCYAFESQISACSQTQHFQAKPLWMEACHRQCPALLSWNMACHPCPRIFNELKPMVAYTCIVSGQTTICMPDP